VKCFEFGFAQSRLVIWLIWSLLLLALVSCEIDPTSDPVYRSDLIGAYMGKVHGGLCDSLWLNQDSTYLRKFESFSHKVFLDKGTWHMFSNGPGWNPRQISIEFLAFVDRFDPDSIPKTFRLSGSVGFPDSLPTYRIIGVFKTQWNSEAHIILGGPYSIVWERTTGYQKADSTRK
jgi:hypothetical protein